MDGYEKFKQIMAELNYKIQKQEDKPKTDLPPGFEELFRGFKEKR